MSRKLKWALAASVAVAALIGPVGGSVAPAQANWGGWYQNWNNWWSNNPWWWNPQPEPQPEEPAEEEVAEEPEAEEPAEEEVAEEPEAEEPAEEEVAEEPEAEEPAEEEVAEEPEAEEPAEEEVAEEPEAEEPAEEEVAEEPAAEEPAEEEVAEEEEDPSTLISSLKGVKLPEIDDFGIIKDKLTVQQLGKALFWDIAVGSDGMACASCHFHAGVDIRLKNQVNPGHDGKFDRLADGSFTGPNSTLQAGDFPFRKFKDVDDRKSEILQDLNDRFSSAGTFAGEFVSVRRKSKGFKKKYMKKFAHGVHRGLLTGIKDRCKQEFDPDNNPFHVWGLIHRKVEPRHTPTTINAAFNFRQFWDGRANATFNGVDPFGRRTNEAVKSAGILKGKGKSLELQKLEMKNSSLASQAVGPPLSDFEMSCSERTFPDIGRKLIKLAPLSKQKVARDDSLFSKSKSLIQKDQRKKGLKTTYKKMIEKAFDKKYWGTKGKFVVDENGKIKSHKNGFSHMELNFSLFWGLAIQEYERLLISDQTPFDKDELSEDEKKGKDVFLNKGKCVACHKGPLFSGAAIPPLQLKQLVERMEMGDKGIALYDNGFYNIGVSPTDQDLGVGDVDPFGNPLSHTRQFKKIQTEDPIDREVKQVDPCTFEVPFSSDSNECKKLPDNLPQHRDAVDGAFKTPILRNVGLTPPYFHNGGQSTLMQVVEFYNRGGDRQGPDGNDNTGFGENGSNLDADIRKLGLNQTEKENLVKFMLALTDERVACHSGVFDHPELPLTEGHANYSVKGKLAKDIKITLPAVGKKGLKGIGKPCFPNTGELFGELQWTFNEILQ